MAIPSKATGGGNTSQARNVFRVTFSQTLSAVPTLEAWDDNTYATTANEIFAGTDVMSTIHNGSVPLLAAAATTTDTPASDWNPSDISSVVSGGATINRLKGTTNYVNLASTAPNASDTIRFNLCLEIPSDATVPSTSSLTHVVAVRYQYTGSAPTLTWEFNDDDAGGTEGTPSWTTITAGGTHIIKHGDSGVASSNIFVTRPSSGTTEAAETWVTSP
jgi:hypothetical protein